MIKQNSKKSRTRLAASLGILAFSLAACEENGFLPPGEGTRPDITAMAMSPDPVVEGDTIEVAIEASGSRAITQVRLELRGAVVRDTTIAVPEPERNIAAVFTIPVRFGTGPDSLLSVDAFVIDAAEVESDGAQDTVFIIDATPPAAALTASPARVGSGDPVTLTVTASDARGLASVGYVAIDGATGDTVSIFEEAVPAGTLEFTGEYTMTGPALDPTTLQIRALAVDRNGLTAESSTANVGLDDLLGPAVEILGTQPDSTVPFGDSVQVHIEASDPSGIKRLIFVGLAARGDTLLGTDTVVTRFSQFTINFPRPGEDELPETVTRAPYLKTADDSTSEAITIVVLAEDGFGNISEVTRKMFVGGPDVSLVYPTQDVAFGLGQTFDVRVRLSDTGAVDSAKIYLGGALNQTIDLPLPARTDTPFVIVQTITLPSTEGTVTLSARAWNREGVAGQTRQINIDVLADPPTDLSPPVVSVTAEMLVPEESKPRMELKDKIRIRVSARDEGSAGLERIGFKAVVSRAGGQYVITESTSYSASNSLEEHEFTVPLDSLYALLGITGDGTLDALLPDEIDLRIHAFAADTVGSLACSVGIEEQRTCTPAVYTDAGTFEAADTTGLLLEITAVRGHTVLLANTSAVIADLAVDTVDDRLFLSNITQNLVELLELDQDPDAMAFLEPVQVGSQPWGIFIGERVVTVEDAAFIGGIAAAGDTVRTLIVGNSGGTNMSLVHLDPVATNIQEADVVRLRTPNAVLHEIQEAQDEFGNMRFLELTPPYDFSDRPQFLAQDSLLRLVYSTVPTEAENTSTVRYVAGDPDPTSAADEPEVRFLLNASMVDTEDATRLALANIDSVHVLGISGGDDSVRIFTHEPGYPQNPIFNAVWRPQFTEAVADVIAQIDAVMAARGPSAAAQAPMFYPFLVRGAWDLDKVGLSDTTFISASSDRGKIAIGEGAQSPTGRIILWHADERAAISSEIEILDLINNASERVLGVGLNWDGSLGVVRGAGATYFFTPDLRLQGLYQQPEQGGAGATFHPGHNSVFDGGHSDTGGAGVAFTGTPVRTIDIVNTFHFDLVNSLFIRDNVVGPLRAGPPLANDNVGLTCPTDAACVVAKLYGITDAGGVVIVNVRTQDLIN